MQSTLEDQGCVNVLRKVFSGLGLRLKLDGLGIFFF